MTEFTPRSSQREILAYRGGHLGISAVPGSGKTHTLSALAAKIVSSGELKPDQEVLIVTLVNSAVDNFAGRIREFIQARRLIPLLGYRVRTLHGLAHDIVREDPPLVGLDKKFSIMDETASLTMMHDAANAWVHTHPGYLISFISPELNDYQRRRVESKDWLDYIEGIAASFIRSAKNQRLSPEHLRLAMKDQPSPLPLAEMGLEIYSDYQRALSYRGAIDFDDLVRYADELLTVSSQLRDRLHYRWPYILEDEAQDSSRIQQNIISALVGDDGNWVRVGDPNQAIFESFTTADPDLLREFVRKYPHVDMPESGRCQPSIMNLANHLIDWVTTDHPLIDARNSLSLPHIEPAPKGDPQSNPQDDREAILLLDAKFSPEQEIEEVVISIEQWFQGYQDIPDKQKPTVAVLTSINDHAAKVAEALKAHKIEYRELLKSTSPTRATAGALSHVLSCLAEPVSSSKLARAYRVWRRAWREDAEHLLLYEQVAGYIRKLKNLEDVLYPRRTNVSGEGLDLGKQEPSLQEGANAEQIHTEWSAFRDVVCRWHSATVLPIDQLVLTLSQDLFTESTELALSHKLALVLRQVADENPHWRLPELIPSLKDIARNERRFIGFSSDDSGFNPDNYPGVVVVSTMHKAKGLEWDRVYLLSVNNYDYPSNQPNDRYISEKWFLRDRLNLEAEALAQLNAALSASEFESYREGVATRRARLDYVRERIRLLYVGLTRARRELIISWNSGRRGDATPSVPFAALQDWGAEWMKNQPG